VNTAYQRFKERTEGIEYQTLRLYPILVKDMELATSCFDVWKLFKRAQDNKYRKMSYLRMLYEMQLDGTQPFALFKVLQILALTFRIELNNFLALNIKDEPVIFCSSAETDEVMQQMLVMFNPVSTSAKEYNEVGLTMITAQDFDNAIIGAVNLRKRICELNGIELPNEKLNVAVYKEWMEMQREKAAKLTYDHQEYIWSACNILHESEASIYEMTLYEFLGRMDAAHRLLMWKLCSDPQLTWEKDPNPYPDWRWNSAEQTYGLTKHDEFAGL